MFAYFAILLNAYLPRRKHCMSLLGLPWQNTQDRGAQSCIFLFVCLFVLIIICILFHSIVSFKYNIQTHISNSSKDRKSGTKGSAGLVPPKASPWLVDRWSP